MLEKSYFISLLNEALGQTAKLRKGGNELVYFCPKCFHPKRKMELCIDESSSFFGIYNCWVCQNSGNFGKLLRLVNAPAPLQNKLYQLTKDILKTRHIRQVKSDPEEVVLPNEFHPLSTPVDLPEYKNAMVYLKRRGVLREDILRYNIGYGGEGEGEYSQHLIFPSYDLSGSLNFFIGRKYYDIPGQINYKKPECSMNIIGFECFINWKYGEVSLVEGVFDAIAVRNNAIPLFGKYLQPKLKEAIIQNKVKRVNMILDNDALDDAVSNCQELIKIGIEVCVIKLDGKDPSVLQFNKMQELICNAKPFEFEDLMKYKIGL